MMMDRMMMDRTMQTVVLLIMPSVTLVITQGISISEGSEFIFVSDALNVLKEPWGSWALRYSLWNVTFFGLFYFKYKAFPTQIRWLAYFNLGVYLLTLWSGFTMDDPDAYMGSWRQYSHWVMSGVCFILFAVETPAIWWPETSVAVIYTATALVYIACYLLVEVFDKIPDTGIPYIGSHVEIPFEYVILYAHFVIVWLRTPLIEKEGFKSGPCSCCCSNLNGAKPDGFEQLQESP